jgi:hypothetical protein
MSALGQKQTSEHDWIMSALPPKADIVGHGQWAQNSVDAPRKFLKVLPAPERDEGQYRDDVNRNCQRAQ